MPIESRNGFTDRYRWAIALSTALAAVVLLVFVYRLTAPTPQRTTSSGDQIPEGDVLRVGALPVT